MLKGGRKVSRFKRVRSAITVPVSGGLALRLSFHRRSASLHTGDIIEGIIILPYG
ncbi:hypothetical protein HG1285_06730 [Hydrogenivirga sp. 128-5-R1-1]|nr:hypothetical protein HG1285_06730 [Hydrogenivirga sp. 128-5-R1-1]